jgi:crotonobetainyl-CoA:carnitine CoA-transferase CaiB-like acyl-CoA transferase
MQQLQVQVSESGLAIGLIRTAKEFAEGEWVKEWGAVVQIDDRSGGTTPMPGNPWLFSRSQLPPPGSPAFQGEHNQEILAERGVPADRIETLRQRHILLSRRSPTGPFD